MSILRHRSAPRRGFNLVEAAIVLGVVGLIIGGIWTAASAVYSSKKISDLQRGTLSVVASMRRIYGSMPLPPGGYSVTPEMYQAGIFPEDVFSFVPTHAIFPVRHNIPDPDFPGAPAAVLVYTQGNPPAAAFNFGILYNYLDNWACTRLLMSLAGVAQTAGIVIMQVGSTIVFDTSNATPDTTVTLSEAQTACTGTVQLYIFFIR